MGTIIVGWTPMPEGEAALRHAVDEATLREDELLVVNVSARSDPPQDTFADDAEVRQVEALLKAAGVTYTLRQLVRGKDAAEEIVGLAAKHDARSIVIGLRQRSPVGKLLLGSNSQRILLEAHCPVIAVKASHTGKK